MSNLIIFTRILTWKTSLLRTCSFSTIFALSSGQGKCGVAVVRVSGPEARRAIKEMTKLKNLPVPRNAMLRSIVHPVSKEILDRGIVIWFPGPNSFTGEDSCEFHVHGGVAVVNSVLNGLGSLPKFQLAEPGEFTRRAFHNGKLDLTEIEGLADLIHAETEAQRKQALLQSQGSLSKLYTKWRSVLLNSVARVEAHIDFEETETLEDDLMQSVVLDITSLAQDLEKHLNDGVKGEILRNGVKTVIIGEPNVGKSSLLNLLCQRPASIVTPISGTTRDIVEVTLNIDGYPLILSDTAGLRSNSKDVIEIEGMARAIENYKKADLILLVVDFENYKSYLRKYNNHKFIHYLRSYVSALGIPELIESDSNQLHETFTKDCIVVLNKTDLDTEKDCESIDSNIIRISCKNEDGSTDLVDALSQKIKIICGEPSHEHPSLNQARHREQINLCLHSINQFLEASSKESVDLVIAAEYLRKSLRSLGKLLGIISSEEILDVIFRDFCIGK